MKRLILHVLFVLGLLSPLLAHAKVYYINKGVKYHIGDNRFALSEDSTFVGAHDTVGQEWIQAFKMSDSDKVKVHIDKIWGVDDCSYCKVIISIDDRDMLRLFQSNNYKPVDTLAPLAQTLQPGVTHYLKIASYGDASVDDFMIQDVSVETDAEITLIGTPTILMPEATPTPAAVINPCESAVPNTGWMPGELEGKTQFEMWSRDRNGLRSGVLGKLGPGEAFDFYMQVDSLTDKPGMVDHVVEFVLQGDEKLGQEKQGWVLSFKDARGTQLHGNMIRDGLYRADAFVAGAYQPNGWNHVRIHSCGDGQIRLVVNEVNATLSIPSGLQPLDFSIRTIGLRAVMGQKPRAVAPPVELPPNFSPGGL